MNRNTSNETKSRDERVAYWREVLEGAPLALDLPVDHTRGEALDPNRSGVFAESLTMNASVTAGLTLLARTHGVALGTTLLAAFAAFLGRHSGQDEVVVGVPVAVPHVLPLRVPLSRDPTFAELLARTAQVEHAARAHEISFDDLLASLDVPQDPGRHPIHQAAFSFAESTPEVAAREALDIALALRPGSSELSGRLECSARLFDASTVARMRDRLLVFLADVAAHPDARLSSLEILPEGERAAILQRVTPETFPLTQSAVEIFEARVERAPDAVAVVAGSITLTYRQLNERANRLAHALRDAGVGPDVLVAFCLERNADPIIAILGILKAGGAYVPIDPSYPPERRAWIIEDSKARVALTGQGTSGALQAETVLVLDDVISSSSRSENPSPRHSLDDLAYVIYTSGSTGRPKGSLIPHRNVVRLMKSTEGWFRFGPEDCWTVFHSFAFDFSVWEVWGALFYGGRVVVVPYATSRDPSAMVELVIEQGVTVLNQTPSAFRLFMQSALSKGSALPLRWIIFGGEALDVPSLAPWFDRYGDRAPTLVNMYGITETTVHVTYRPLRAEDARSPRSVIGVPLRDLTLHVLDSNMRLSPIGITGELHVGGAGASRGYLGRPALTAERFVPDPFSTSSGARLYRSGDLGRRLPNGDVEYLGRADFQVKIRGFRIELGEIEQVLVQHPSVAEAVVLVREDVPGDKRLVAYLVSKAAAPSVDAIREHLRGRLPEYMVPSAVVVVSAWPLTGNGKLDRAALPAPEARTVVAETSTPTNEIETAIAKMWCALLRVDEVGVDDDFFDLGGHSLILAQLAVRIAKELGVELSLAALFDALTVREMAALVAEALAGLSNDDAELAAMLAEVEGLSTAEAEALLGAEGT